MTKQSDEAHEALVEELAILNCAQWREFPGITVEAMRPLWETWSDSSKAPWLRQAAGSLALIAERLGEVTEEMKRAWSQVSDHHDDVWRAMLTASPLVPGDAK